MSKKEKIKMVHLIEGLGSGGAERLLFTNLKHFAPESVESEVITVFPQADHWKKPIEDLGVKVSSLDCQNLRDLPKGLFRLRAKLKESRPRLLHTHLWAANIIGRLAGFSLRIPVLSSLHNPDYEPEAFEDGSGIGRGKKWLIRSLDKWTSRLACRKMLAVSEYVKESTVRRLNFPAQRIEVLYNPIDAEAFTGCGRDEKILDELEIPSGAPVLLNVARVSPQKGLIYAIRALPAVKARFPSVRFVSVGVHSDPPWSEKIKAEIESLGLRENVILTGVRRDIPNLLQTCDVFVFPSLHEGLGIALLEAMAVGCACVVSRTGPIPEFVEQDENGLLVEPKDASALAEKIIELLADEEKRARLGRAARTLVLSKFQPATAARRLTEIYFSLITAD